MQGWRQPRPERPLRFRLTSRSVRESLFMEVVIFLNGWRYVKNSWNFTPRCPTCVTFEWYAISKESVTFSLGPRVLYSISKYGGRILPAIEASPEESSDEARVTCRIIFVASLTNFGGVSLLAPLAYPLEIKKIVNLVDRLSNVTCYFSAALVILTWCCQQGEICRSFSISFSLVCWENRRLMTSDFCTGEGLETALVLHPLGFPEIARRTWYLYCHLSKTNCCFEDTDLW